MLSFSDNFLPAISDVEEVPHSVEVEAFNAAEYAEPSAETKEASDVGKEVNQAVQFAPFMAQEVSLAKEYVDQSQVGLDIGIVKVLRMIV